MGATDNGLFVVQFPSPYSHFSQDQGLRGEVLSLEKIGEQIYAGTLNGLFRRNGHSFVQVDKMNYACWELIKYEGGLLAATSNGVYKVAANGTINQLTTSSTTSILADGNGFYTGEQDGVFHHVPGKAPVKVCEAERVTKFLKDKKGIVWMQNLYGRIWNNENGTFAMKEDSHTKDEISTLVMYQDKATIIPASATKPFPYPLFSYTDSEGILWLTNNKGKSLYALENGSKNNDWEKIAYPLMDYNVRTILHDGNHLWLGSANGVIVADISRKDPTKVAQEVLSALSLSMMTVSHGEVLENCPPTWSLMMMSVTLPYAIPWTTPHSSYEHNTVIASTVADGAHGTSTPIQSITTNLMEVTSLRFKHVMPLDMYQKLSDYLMR